MSIALFDQGDDNGYTTWLAVNRSGYVLNSYAPATANYLVLHAAACRHVTRLQRGAHHWTHGYEKRCSPQASDLVDWAVATFSVEPRRCSRCKP
jgi:hypothetical protein